VNHVRRPLGIFRFNQTAKCSSPSVCLLVCHVARSVAIIYLTTHSKKPTNTGDRSTPQARSRADSAKAVSGNEDWSPISPEMANAVEFLCFQMAGEGAHPSPSLASYVLETLKEILAGNLAFDGSNVVPFRR
jgi:hypothetical protein